MSGNHQNQKRHPIRGFFWVLKQIFFLACVLIAGFAVIGYASGWVKIDHNKQQEKATIEIDTGQVKKSVEESVEKGKELIESGGDKLDELTTTDGNPTDAREGEVTVTETPDDSTVGIDTADEPQPIEAATPDESPQRITQTYQGKILSVEDDQLTMLGTETLTFLLADEPSITVHGKPAELTDLKSNQPVVVIAERAENGFVATVIAVP